MSRVIVVNTSEGTVLSYLGCTGERLTKWEEQFFVRYKYTISTVDEVDVSSDQQNITITTRLLCYLEVRFEDEIRSNVYKDMIL